MTHKIHQGGALEVLKTMPDQSVDMILTGPPYYGEPLASDDPRTIGKEGTPDQYLRRLLPVFAECSRVLKLDGNCFVMVRGDWISNELVERLETDGWYLVGGRLIYPPSREHLLRFRRKNALTPHTRSSSFPTAPDGNYLRSATMSPLIAEHCIENGSNPGDTILDPFCGTGVTPFVAVSMGRNAIGIEIAPSQIALIEKRMELLDSQVLERR